MYSLTGYGTMVADSVRRRAYIAALERVIQPGCTVLEIGTGPGIFAILAARLGARKVYAIEPDDSIEVARQLVSAHGLDDKIELFQGWSTRFEPPQPVDVIFSDLRGILPLFRSHLPAVIDARERLLDPRGTLIPQRDRLWVTLVEAEEAYGAHVDGWSDHGLNLDLSIAREFTTNTWGRTWIGDPEQCLVEPWNWATLDYTTVVSLDARGHAEWRVRRNGRAHGLLLWFDTELVDGVGYSTAPGESRLVYRQQFLPLPQPVDLRAGDRVSLRLEAIHTGTDYVWRWQTEIEPADGPASSFDQSTFFSRPVSLASLRKRAGGYVPQLNDKGRVLDFVLRRMDGHTSLEVIARELYGAFPGRFEDWRQAFERVAEIAESCSD